MKHVHVHGTILTHVAPSSNYRGENSASVTTLQTLQTGETLSGDKVLSTLISAQAIRNGFREALPEEGLPVHRERKHGAKKLTVTYSDFLYPDKYADVFLLGGLNIDKDEKKQKGERSVRSLLRVNHAMSVGRFRDESTFHQSPLGEGAYKNSNETNLYRAQILHTAYQFPFNFNLGKVRGPDQLRWATSILSIMADPSDVAGNHARTWFSFAPASAFLRVTARRNPQYDLYGFKEDGSFPDTARIREGDLPGSEFWIGGEVVRSMPQAERSRLEAEGATLYDNASTMLCHLAAKLKKEFSGE